jgi:DNA-binding response OmpR family regulator
MNDPATVLVVDDIPANRKLLADILSNAGYTVISASSGEEALEKVASAEPDLVLLDILMPGLNGYEVCQCLRADSTTGVLPIVMVTALDPTKERIKGLEAGADDFLTKPINPAELLARVRSLLRIKSLYDTVQSQSAELAELNAGLEKRVQEQLGELQRLDRLKRFFAPQVAELIVSGDMSDPLKTHRSEVTVVLLKLRGFNGLADTSEPEEVMAILRNYHREMGKAVDLHGGTLEQLSGNTMMVVFNDPVMVEDPAPRAVRMAVEMRTRFEELMADWRRRGHEISLGIGIAHGYATIGSIGYESRLAYGVIGRVMNLALRLSDEAASGEILVTAPVHALVDALVEAAEASEVNMEGFAKPVSVYSIQGLKDGKAKNEDTTGAALRVHTFGQFALHVNGSPLTFSRKVQKRPLDLLKVLIGLGGERVEIAGITSLLWPEAEGDTAKASFDSTLYRLRKLLSVPDVLRVSEGRLSLDRERCWVDVWAFDDLVSRIESANLGTEAVPPEEYVQMTRALLQLYTGHFLDQESQEPWAIAARDQLRAKFIRAVTKLGGVLEERKDWEQAATLYLRALELDNLAEALYRRLMIVYCEQGELAEAINIYRRCRDMLSVVLNTKPSTETEAIRRAIAPD